MTENDNILPWREPDWIEEASQWIKNSLTGHNISMPNTPEQIHAAPWSVVYRLSTSSGNFYFKALCPALRHEPALTQHLAQWLPEKIQPVFEIEPTRGWMLMPEGGSTLRQVLEKSPSLNYWKKILPQYAQLQKDMIPHQAELLALGVKDRRLKVLPGLAQALAEDRNAMCIGSQDGLSELEYKNLFDALPKLKTLCADLAEYGIPETLQHDDFHDGNIFVTQNGFRFFDWAEAFVAHPFFTLVVTLRSIAYRFDLDENSPEIHQLEDVYLSEWQEFAPLTQLREAFEISMIIGRINRALTWHGVVSTLPEPYRSQEAEAVPGWIQLFLEKINPSA